LDQPIDSKNNHSKIINSINNAKIMIKNKKNSEILFFASLQGYDSLTLKNSIKYLNKCGDFDGYALGGALNYYSNYKLLVNNIISVKKELNNKPFHLYGLSGHTIIPLLIYMGVDTFDSSSFVKAAAFKRYLIPLQGRKHLSDIGIPLNKICNCRICKENTYEEIFNSRELLSFHNIWVINDEIKRTIKHVHNNELENYLVSRYKNNPWAIKAFNFAKRRIVS